MQFFKHYNNARKTPAIQEIMAIEGKEGYFHYMALLEVLSEKFDGEREEVAIHVSDLLKELDIKQRKKLDNFLDKVNQVSVKIWEELGKVSVKKIRVAENFYFFEVPILVDLQGKDFKFATKQRQTSDPKNKDKRIKNKKKDIYGIHEKLNHELLKPHFEKIKIETQEKWFKAYPDSEWVKAQLIKAVLWLSNNSTTRKDMSRYFGNWLSNSTYGKSNPPDKTSLQASPMASKIFDEVIRSGSHGFMSTVANFGEIERRAISIFGRASEIINCPNDFEANSIKKRLREACEQAIKESASSVAC
jgi:hypothetical protein